MTRKSKSNASTLLLGLLPATGILGALWAIHEGNCKALTDTEAMHE